MRTENKRLEQMWSTFYSEANGGRNLRYEEEKKFLFPDYPIIRIPLFNVKVVPERGDRFYYELKADQFPRGSKLKSGIWIPRTADKEAEGRVYLGSFQGNWSRQSEHEFDDFGRPNSANLEEMAWRLSATVTRLKQIPSAFLLMKITSSGEGYGVPFSSRSDLERRFAEEFFCTSGCESVSLYQVILFGG